MSEFQRPTHVEIDGQPRAVEWGQAIAMLGGLAVKGGYEFEEAKLETGEVVGFYHLPAHVPTRVVRITGEVECRERVVQGVGLFVSQAPRGDITFQTQEANSSREVWYSTGSVVVWIGGNNGARILSRTKPEFTTDMEIPIKVDSLEIPDKFWAVYHQALSGFH